MFAVENWPADTFVGDFTRRRFNGLDRRVEDGFGFPERLACRTDLPARTRVDPGCGHEKQEENERRKRYC
jgi:hypothetical protein